MIIQLKDMLRKSHTQILYNQTDENNEKWRKKSKKKKREKDINMTADLYDVKNARWLIRSENWLMICVMWRMQDDLLDREFMIHN